MFGDELDPGKGTPPHWHPEPPEAVYMLDGEILRQIDGRDQRSSYASGNAIIPQNIPYEFEITSAPPR